MVRAEELDFEDFPAGGFRPCPEGSSFEDFPPGPFRPCPEGSYFDDFPGSGIDGLETDGMSGGVSGLEVPAGHTGAVVTTGTGAAGSKILLSSGAAPP